MIAAEFIGATLLLSHPRNYRTANRKPSDIEHLVVHVTDGQPKAEEAAKRLQKPVGTSANFFVGQLGEIFQTVLIKDIAQHAHDVNPISIGIEHCARSPRELGPNDPGLPVSELQLASSARLHAFLLDLCGLVPDRVVIQGHVEIDPKTTHEDCPNAIWPWDRFMDLVRLEYENLQFLRSG